MINCLMSERLLLAIYSNSWFGLRCAFIQIKKACSRKPAMIFFIFVLALVVFTKVIYHATKASGASKGQSHQGELESADRAVSPTWYDVLYSLMLS